MLIMKRFAEVRINKRSKCLHTFALEFFLSDALPLLVLLQKLLLIILTHLDITCSVNHSVFPDKFLFFSMGSIYPMDPVQASSITIIILDYNFSLCMPVSFNEQVVS